MSKITTFAELRAFAAKLGLSVGRYSPGDGFTRYRIFERESAAGPAGIAIFTGIGSAEAMVFLKGYAAGSFGRVEIGQAPDA